MKIDAKHKLLYAIYIEYLKDLPDMESVQFNSVGLEWEVYLAALSKLENEEFITPISSRQAEIDYKEFLENDSLQGTLFNFSMTKHGVDYVETQLYIDKYAFAQVKLERLSAVFKELGCDELSKLAEKALTNF